MARAPHGEILLRTVAVEATLEHPSAMCDDALDGPVCGARVDHEDFIAKRERLDAGINAVCLVERDDAGGDWNSRHRVAGLVVGA